MSACSKDFGMKAEADGSRWHWLLAVGVFAGTVALLFVLLAFPPDHTIDMGAPNDTRFATDFYPAERTAQGTFRWSGPDSHLLLHGVGSRPLVLGLRIHMDEQALDSIPTLTIQRAEHTLARFVLPQRSGWRTYHVLLPPEAVADPLLRALPLQLTSSTYTPGAHDQRDLGFPLDQVSLRPLAGATLAVYQVLGRALLLAWGVALLAGVVWRLLSALMGAGVAGAALTWGLAAAGLALWVWRDPYTLAWVLPSAPWVLGAGTLLLLLTLRGEQSLTPLLEGWNASRLHPRTAGVLLVGVFVLALVLRFYRLDELPYGLWRDEARHGLVALRILNDPAYRPVYEPGGGVDLPGLGFYPFALALSTWGIHDWTLRTVTALAGALTVLPLYALVRRLFAHNGVALLAALFLAVSSWHIAISRFSFPTVFDPLLTLTGLWLLLAGLQRITSNQQAAHGGRSRSGWLTAGGLLLAGVSTGLAVHTYHTGRFSLLLAGALALFWLWQQRQHWRGWLVAVLLFGLGYGLAVAPLAGYALRHPEVFNDRVGDVALLSEKNLDGRAPLAVFDEAVGRHLLMFHVQGDSNGRHHAPDYPMLDVITGLGLLLGGVLLLRSWRDWRSLFLLVALALTVVPSLLAVNGPHAMRSFGAGAFACAIAALGWVAALSWLARRSFGRRVAGAAGATVVLVALALNTWVYFVAMPVEPRVWTSSYPVHTQIGSYLREMAAAHDTPQQVYVTRRLVGNDVFRYLTRGVSVDTFSETGLSRPVQPGALFVLSGYTHAGDLEALHGYLNRTLEPVAAGPELPGTGDPSFLVYRVQGVGSGD